jgi:transcriptional regulator with XRE-family HTH domain
MNIADMTQAVLDAYGMSETDLAQRVGCSQPTINRIKQGVQMPGFGLGAAIQALYDARPVSGEATPSEAAA